MNKNDKEFIAQEIRTRYMPKENTELDELRRLDGKVKRPANAFAYAFGSISAIIMGCGMSLIMTDIGEKIGISDAFIPGVIIGAVGLIMAVANYPIYKGILSARKKKFADKIIAISERILNKN